MKIYLRITRKEYELIWYHLFGKNLLDEEAAFLFTKTTIENNSLIFEYIGWYPIPSKGFIYRSEQFFELTDKTRAFVIKRAHDLDASLIEIHSHTGPWPAAFSFSDNSGFDEFVPHVLWRLKGRPYSAIVFTRSDFDGLVWIKKREGYYPLNGIIVDKKILYSTRLSMKQDDLYEK